MESKQEYPCKTCKHCIAIRETAPFGQCIFFPSGQRVITNVNKESCSNHSILRDEEYELERTQNRGRR